MKRDYDFDALARKYQFEPRMVEKVCRISDILEDITAVRFLREHLSLYGGTALTFIHLQKRNIPAHSPLNHEPRGSPEIPRLSIDIDMNYRHQGQKDWGEVRRDIDEKIKTLLYMQGYDKNSISIDPTYPLARIVVGYTNHRGLKDSYNIEVGYMRRCPILRVDSLENFKHIGTGETFPVTTPVTEELLSNKWCTLLYRGTPRDLFDVFQIATLNLNKSVFLKCAVIDSLMRGRPKLNEINIDEKIDGISIDSSLKNLLRADVSSTLDIQNMIEKSKEFSKNMIDSLNKEEIAVINRFYEQKRFEPERMDTEGILNNNIAGHPSIQWIMKNI